MDRFFVLILINTLCVVGYVIRNRISRKEQSIGYLPKAIVMFLCPVVGVLVIGLGYVIRRLILSDTVDLEDVIFSKDKVKTYMRADEERGRNVVSMEEALAITDKDNLRSLMLDVIRGDIRDSLASISLALDSEDSETSHYAASVLQDALNDFRVNVQKCYQEIQNNEELQGDYSSLLLDYMNQVLRQQVFTDMEQRAFVEKMDSLCELIYVKRAAQMSSFHMQEVCMRLLEIKEYDKCAKWCERAVQMFPDVLSTYTCQLKLYFSMGERERFFEVLSQLRNSRVVIDNETLELIRVFQQ